MNKFSNSPNSPIRPLVIVLDHIAQDPKLNEDINLVEDIKIEVKTDEISNSIDEPSLDIIEDPKVKDEIQSEKPEKVVKVKELKVEKK